MLVVDTAIQRLQAQLRAQPEASRLFSHYQFQPELQARLLQRGIRPFAELPAVRELPAVWRREKTKNLRDTRRRDALE